MAANLECSLGQRLPPLPLNRCQTVALHGQAMRASPGQLSHERSLEPKAFRPLRFRTPERVRERHRRINALREQGYLLKQIALDVGLKHPQSVLPHLNGKCGCAG